MSNRPKSDLHRKFALHHEDLVDYFAKSLTDYELVSLLYQVFNKRTDTIQGDDALYRESLRFILARQTHVTDNGLEESDVHFVAPQRQNATPQAPFRSLTLCETGRCHECERDVVSFSTRATCPLCGSAVICND